MQPQGVNTFLKQLRDNWFIIIFIGGIIMSWSNFSNKITNLTEAQQEQKKGLMDLSKSNTDLSNTIIEIKANYLFIKDSLNELKKK